MPFIRNTHCFSTYICPIDPEACPNTLHGEGGGGGGRIDMRFSQMRQ